MAELASHVLTTRMSISRRDRELFEESPLVRVRVRSARASVNGTVVETYKCDGRKTTDAGRQTYMIPKFQIRHRDPNSNAKVNPPRTIVSGHPVTLRGDLRNA